MLSKCHIVTIVISGLLIAGAVVLIVGNYPQKLIDGQINDQLVISMDSPEYDDWMTPPPPIYMQYWMFNVTNTDEVIAGGKPNVTQVGPFTYRLYQPRYNVIFYENESVSYQYNHTLVFEPSMSYEDPHDVTIMTLNVPLLTVAGMLKNMHFSPFIKKMVKFLINFLQDSKVFMPHTAHELLFGYKDELLSLAHTVIPSFPADFGFFYGFNNTDDGVYLINSGKNNITHTNDIQRWNFERHLSFWSDEYGNMLNGTDGVFYHPGMKATERIYAFSTDICRSLPFEFELDTSVRSIDTYRYHTTLMAFANSSVNPDNGAFCVPAGNCMDSGVLNISVCKQNAPVVISSPHFYLAAESYIQAVNGLNPTKQEHETYLDIEPTTGTVLRANKRLQLNIQVEPSSFSKELENIRILTFPVVWLNESVFVDKISANHLRGVLMLKGFVLSLPYVLFGVSALLIIIVVVLVFRKKRMEKGTPLLTDVDDEEDSSNKT